MSSDLLAEFDSFYQAPQKTKKSSSAADDLSFLSDTKLAGQHSQGNGQPTTQWQNTSTTDSLWGDMTSFSQPIAAQSKVAARDNIWDAFEAAPGPSNVSHQQFVTPKQTAQLPGYGQNSSFVGGTPTLDLFPSNLHDQSLSTSSQLTTRAEQSQPSKQPTAFPDTAGEVLFDADEEGDDDDFGDFETVTAPAESVPQQIDLLFGATSLESKPRKTQITRPANVTFPPSNILNPLPYPQAPISPSFQERNPFAELGLATNTVLESKQPNHVASPSPVTAWPTYEPKISRPAPFQDSPIPANGADDDWGDFADLPAETPTATPGQETSGTDLDSWGWDWADKASAPAAKKAAPSRRVATAVTKSASQPPTTRKDSDPAPIPTPKSVPAPAKEVKKDAPPPTNIPPPSLLLTLFPPLFNLPQSKLFQPVSDQPFSLKNRIMSDPGTVRFLRAYILIATVAARIIAGRKLRWKRDNHLSQAMKIGPASAKGKGGMKLTGVDKAEMTRENREASEVVRIWKEQLGRLKSAVAAANSSNHDILSHIAIPEIGEVMHVNTLKGAMTDVKACLVCGLKREERVTNVDIDELIEDSFGEWWIGYWGHRDCRNFWEEHESKLKNH
ncbi:hypothetical protein PVAG01_02765 [Phlyctema vagabunda]|uniref:Serine/threonine-protein kinase ppk6 n=1 Tax=Phlyctema vagabunda TaxID=108571 RepID=A0ABR4PRI2_9HELO